MVLLKSNEKVSISKSLRLEFGWETYLRTVAAAVVETVQAPPAVVFLQALQCQIPTAVRLTESYRKRNRNWRSAIHPYRLVLVPIFIPYLNQRSEC